MEPRIQKIERYIALTRLDEAAEKGYGLHPRDMLALCGEADRDASRAICRAFLFGRAKGYRAAKSAKPT